MKITSTASVLLAATTGLLLTASGCAPLGPASIRNGRAAYAESIAVTNAQQTLKAFVAIRYAETPVMLNIASITASMKFRGEIGANAGVGPDESFAGNLVPLSGGVAYEENPTISYVPVDDAQYMEEMLAPVPLKVYLLLLGSGHSQTIFRMLTERVNGIANPIFTLEQGTAVDHRFEQLVEVLTRLRRARCIDWGRATADGEAFAMVIHNYAPHNIEDARRFTELCGIPMKQHGKSMTIPIYLGAGEAPTGAIAIETRSLYEVIHAVAANIQVPETHATTGLALTSPPLNPGNQQITIRSSADRPATAVLAVRYRDYWFYIDTTDHESRRAFQLVQSLLTARLTKSTSADKRTPVLTVPVGG